MKSNVIDINGARPERWAICVGPSEDNSICCFYSDRTQSWVHMISVGSMDRLPAALDKAQSVMKSARAQNRRVEVAV